MKQLFYAVVNAITSKLVPMSAEDKLDIINVSKEDGSTEMSWRIRLPDGTVHRVYLSVERIS